jgi:hypothetical protein
MSLINSAVFQPYVSNFHKPTGLSSDKVKTRIVLIPEEHKKVISFLKKILSSESKSELKFGKKVYLGSSSNLPRHKVKEYFSTNNIHKTSKLEHADTIIISKESIKDLYKYLTDTATNTPLRSCNKVYLITDDEDKISIKKLVGNSSSNISINIPWYIRIPTGSVYSITSDVQEIISKYQSQSLYLDTHWGKNVSILNTYQVVYDIVTKLSNLHIIFDEDILPIFNQNGLEFNQDYITTLDSMFESRDQENINLALEMLSNIDLEKYSLVLSMFLNKHMGKFYRGSGLNIHQNRSFKSFIKYFDSKNINFKLGWKKFSIQLLLEYKNDPKSIEIIHDFILQNINKFLKTTHNGESTSNWIEIENCTIKLK